MYVNKINFNPSLESYLFGSIRKKGSINSKEEKIGKSIFYIMISNGTDIKIVEEKFIKSKIIFSNRITGIGNKTETIIISP